jgi:hypothetical protein
MTLEDVQRELFEVRHSTDDNVPRKIVKARVEPLSFSPFPHRSRSHSPLVTLRNPYRSPLGPPPSPTNAPRCVRPVAALNLPQRMGGPVSGAPATDGPPSRCADIRFAWRLSSGRGVSLCAARPAAPA